MGIADEEVWPKLGESVFHRRAVGEDWQFNACMSPWTSASTIARGYRDAARLAFAQIAATGAREYLDSAAYAIIFNWRHYLELTLKDLLYTARALVNGDAGKQVTHHRLADLWRELRPLMEQIGGTDTANFDKVERVIAEFVQYDPDSFAFRYATDKQGKVSLPNIPSTVNLRYLDESMASVSSFLDAGGCHLYDLWSHQADMEAEARANEERYYGDQP